MPIYKNTSVFEKTFFGIALKPGEVKQLPLRVNDTSLIIVKSPPKEPPVAAKSSEPAKLRTTPAPIKQQSEVKASSQPKVSEDPKQSESIEQETKEVNT